MQIFYSSNQLEKIYFCKLQSLKVGFFFSLKVNVSKLTTLKQNRKIDSTYRTNKTTGQADDICQTRDNITSPHK